MDRNNQVDPLYRVIRMMPASRCATTHCQLPCCSPLVHFLTVTFTLIADLLNITSLDQLEGEMVRNVEIDYQATTSRVGFPHAKCIAHTWGIVAQLVGFRGLKRVPAAKDARAPRRVPDGSVFASRGARRPTDPSKNLPIRYPELEHFACDVCMPVPTFVKTLWTSRHHICFD